MTKLSQLLLFSLFVLSPQAVAKSNSVTPDFWKNATVYFKLKGVFTKRVFGEELVTEYG